MLKRVPRRQKERRHRHAPPYLLSREFRVPAFPKRVRTETPSTEKSKFGIQIIEDFNFYDPDQKSVV